MRAHGNGKTPQGPLVNPPRFKPRQDRRVNSRTVECPECHADLGVGCVGASTGVPMKTAHKARRRMAVRLLNEEL